MNHGNSIFSNVQRLDGAWRVVFVIDGIEHTYDTGFAKKTNAYSHHDEVLRGLGAGEDLNLFFWESKPLS